MPLVRRRRMRGDWHFPVANGPVIVRLSSTQSTEGGQPIYALQIISGRAVPSVTDEAAFLQTVTTAMESEGIQPTRIGLLLLDMNEPDVSEQLSKAAYESDEWHEAKASNHASVIVKLLNSIGAYKPFNRVFSHYGLTVEVTHAEKISTTSPEQLGLKRNGVSSLPSSATLEMHLRAQARP